MSTRNLKHLFAPRSVAVIGASERPHSVGHTVLHNLAISGFAGAIMPVNPKYKEIAGIKVYAEVSQLPEAPQLAIICTPPGTVPGLIRDLGERGTKAAIVLTAGLATVKDNAGRNMRDLMLAAAKPHLLRILGPNCVGLLVPGLQLNASFAHTGAQPGKIAFVSQSGSMVASVLDWARTRGIGFSKVVSLGDVADVDFGDMLDYLASDWETKAILLYVESIKSARKFMSAARAAARSKPTLVIKAGRVPEARRAATSHAGVMAASDDVYDAAIRRAGMLRVFSTEDLFDAVETLARAAPLKGDRLAIITNGGGPGVMATDTLVGARGKLARLSDASMAALDAILPAAWSRDNPVDIIGDAPAERYIQALEIVSADPGADAILLIHAPTAIVPSADIATALAPVARKLTPSMLASWLGGEAVAQARGIFAEAGIPTFDTPEKAVRGFLRIVQYQRNQQLLMEVPPAASHDVVEDRARARSLIGDALAAGRAALSETESKTVLAAYGIPVVKTRTIATPEEAVRVATEIGFPVAVKILSPDISHKSDVGGVVLDVETPAAVQEAMQSIARRLREKKPDARIEGYAVQTMARRPQGHELIVGVATDPVFGPVVLFGQGGIAVEVTADHAVALPPLNMVLARELISRTRVSKLLEGYRSQQPADIDAICEALIQVCQLVIDIPEIVEMDINPLLADAEGVIALDARIHIRPAAKGGIDRLAIRPYPAELEESVDWHGETILIRPIKPEDAPQHIAFFNALSQDDVRLRVFTGLRELRHAQVARLTQIDYDREMAFIATRKNAESASETIGVVRAIADPDNIEAEFAIIVRSDMKGRGLGRILMKRIIDYCRNRGTQAIVGEALTYNKGLLRLAKDCGFSIHRSMEGDTMLLRLELRPG